MYRVEWLFEWPKHPHKSAWVLYVQKVARHWRICPAERGPALEGYERFTTKTRAFNALERLFTQQEAVLRLGGKPFQSFYPPLWEMNL